MNKADVLKIVQAERRTGLNAERLALLESQRGWKMAEDLCCALVMYTHKGDSASTEHAKQSAKDNLAFAEFYRHMVASKVLANEAKLAENLEMPIQ